MATSASREPKATALSSGILGSNDRDHGSDLLLAGPYRKGHSMIVRAWNGYASATNADDYPKHLLQTVRPKLERVAGVRGLYLLWRGGHDEVQYQVLTLSDSRQAIRAFAGEQLNHAVVEPEARAALVRFDSDVSHFEVFAGPTV